ncbi:phage tail tip fiber protein [Epibacterium sp. Ofav1-8]|uniref:phage tail tip fiber protein n=1 Tax=Epibacterium sp. Ofav1-8 TaxID=2917735 RepID=UPI001EF4BE8B|nr:DUF1983 domain-containing protein [Epibacterium sp. Ofav1-8]MCG7626060.1 DUF1983 domain-containing protein [Epibacterium sp. Ofav1-8]
MINALFFAALVCVFVLSPGAAAAGPLAAAITAIQTFAASSAVAAFVVRIGVSLALSALSTALQGSKKQRAPGIRTETTTTGGVNAQTFILGRYATAGNMVCPPYSYPNSGDEPNRYLTYVVDISDSPGCQLSRVMVAGEYVGDLEAAAGSQLDLRGLEKDGIHHFYLTWHDGSQNAADPFLVSQFSDYPERPWTGDMVGRDVCYAVLVFLYNRSLFNQLPAVRFEVLGIPLYDPRLDSSVGGEGAQRWHDRSTWAFSENPIVMIYNILRGITLPDGSVWGGQVHADDLPLSNWFAAMNECDVQIETADGSYVPQYRAGLEVSTDDQPADVIDQLKNAASAELVEFGGVYKVRVGPPTLPVYFFTDDDVVADRSQTLTPYPGLDGVHNAIHASYPDPDALWEIRDAPPRYNAEWEAEDGGRQLVAQVGLPAVNSSNQAQRLMRAWIEDERRFQRHGLALPPDAMVLEPLDSCSWTSVREGYTAKIFEIGDLTDDLVSCLQTVALREREAGDFVWDPSSEVVPLTPSPVVVVPAPRTVPGFDLRDHILIDGVGEARRVALRLVWDPSAISADELLEWRLQLTDGTPVASGVEADLGSGELILSGGILPDTNYRARARLRALQGGVWSSWVEATTGSTRFAASDLSDAVFDAISADATATASALLTDYDASVIAPMAQDLDLRAVEQRTVAEAVAMIGDQVLWAVTRLSDVDGRLADAGIVTDPETGNLRIYALEQEAERISEAEIRLNAAEASLALSATQAWVNEQISLAILDPSQIPLVEDLQLQVNQVQADLDAVEATLALTASQTEVDGLDVRLSTAEANLDAAEAAIALKAEQSQFDDLQGRVQTAEVQISALDGPAITQTVADTRHLIDSDEAAATQTLANLLQAHEAGERIRQDIAYATQDLRARVDEDRVAEAARAVALGASIDNAMALLEAESLARASADDALASDVVTLDTRLENAEGAITGQAQAQSQLSSRVTTLEGTTTSQAQSIASLTARIGAAEDDQADQASALQSLTVRMSDAEGTLTAQAQSLASLTTTVGENTSTVQTVSESVDGMLGRHMLRVNVNGVATGMVIAAEADDDGAVQSNIALSADAFTVSGPAGQQATSPFAVYTSGRTIGGIYYPPGVYLERGYIGHAMIGRGQITDTMQSDNYAESGGRPTAGLKLDFRNGEMKAVGMVLSRDQVLASGSFTYIGQVSDGARFRFVNTGIRVSSQDVRSVTDASLVVEAGIVSFGQAAGGFDGNNAWWSAKCSLLNGPRWFGFNASRPQPAVSYRQDPADLVDPYWATGTDQRVWLDIEVVLEGIPWIENPKIDWTVKQVT